ncbi:MAG: SDR family oxidoreductase [Prolixibacteraceae bacterium]|jgi:UDP-glucuronate decarboxylase|nr:SDR family oxidoreductase [Prolixibacteraceae bacterium]
MKRILITGGAGFIGSHLCERLLNEGNDVICMDNFLTGTKRNIDHLIGNKYFELVRHDVILPFYAEVDEIYNLACPASPVHYQVNPIKTIKTSVMGAINMLGLAKRTGAKILQASTSEVYGNPEVHPQPESYWGNVNPLGSRSSYDEGKRCAESLFMSYYHQNAVQIKIARIFNTYGPRMRLNDGRVVSNFIIQALRNEPITIYGHGKQTRSFQYVDDLVDGLIRLMNTNKDVTGPVNIGNTNEFSVEQLAGMIKRLTNSKSEIARQTLPEDDPMKRKPDISIAKRLLNWEPRIGLERGLGQTINYYKTKIDNTEYIAKTLNV